MQLGRIEEQMDGSYIYRIIDIHITWLILCAPDNSSDSIKLSHDYSIHCSAELLETRFSSNPRDMSSIITNIILPGALKNWCKSIKNLYWRYVPDMLERRDSSELLKGLSWPKIPWKSSHTDISRLGETHDDSHIYIISLIWFYDMFLKTLPYIKVSDGTWDRLRISHHADYCSDRIDTGIWQSYYKVIKSFQTKKVWQWSVWK